MPIQDGKLPDRIERRRAHLRAAWATLAAPCSPPATRLQREQAVDALVWTQGQGHVEQGQVARVRQRFQLNRQLEPARVDQSLQCRQGWLLSGGLDPGHQRLADAGTGGEAPLGQASLSPSHPQNRSDGVVAIRSFPEGKHHD